MEEAANVAEEAGGRKSAPLKVTTETRPGLTAARCVLADPASSSQAQVHHFCPSLTAQGQSCVVAPSIIGSSICNLNISVTSPDPGLTFWSKETSAPKNRDGCLQPPGEPAAECQRRLKVLFKRRFSHLEVRMTGAQRTSLHQIYTELYISEGGSGGANHEHEVRQIEASPGVHAAQESSIRCCQLFVPAEGPNRQLRTVITRGVAGIGKTVSVHKFTLDWAEDRDNCSLDFVFPLSFRELNLMKTKTLSLEELLAVFFPETKDSGIFRSGFCRMLFILDGLDESRLSLDFHTAEIVTEATQEGSVAVLLVNLLRARLLPQALVWLTSRPVASNQIPACHIDLVTEIRGFSDPQKDEYFRRNIREEALADRVIVYIKSCRSLHIMCHIPMFCWMAATVLQKQLSTVDSEDTPKSLTQMYIHFLSLYVDDIKKRLPGRRESNTSFLRDNLMALGKLAFGELEKGHLIFYEEDLVHSGLEITQASTFSLFYTQIFSEEMILCREKMFCFIHLSIQEFFAALYVFLKFHNDNFNVLTKKSSASRRFPFRATSELLLYKEAVEKALQSEKGHYDMFLRFLLGLSLESNRSLLQHLMSSNRSRQQTRAEIIKHIKEKIQTSPSPDRCVNLFHCLKELNDCSLVDQIQGYLRSGPLAQGKLSASQWNALLVVLLASQEDLGVFDLSQYARSEEGLLRLLPVVRAAQEARLNACRLTVNCCEKLSTAISTSRLRELDLSNNPLADAGVRALWGGLKGVKLDTLRLRSCNLTRDTSQLMARTISSGSCTLRVLDLSDNDLGDAGVKQLCEGLESPGCGLESLLLSLCGLTDESCRFLASALNSSGLRELDLSYNHPGDSGLDLLSALLYDPQCSLQKVSVENCGESRIQPAPLKLPEVQHSSCLGSNKQLLALITCSKSTRLRLAETRFLLLIPDSTKLTLDPNTAQTDLFLSEGNRKARRWTKQPHPAHPERFDFWAQVMSVEGLTGRCYWETEWSGRAFIGAAYRSMSRKGDGEDSWLGKNQSSWGVNCTADGFRAWHNGLHATLTASPSSRKVGVFLDWSAGTLAFYTVVGGALTLLHTFHTTFSEPVHAAFRLGWMDSTVNLC